MRATLTTTLRYVLMEEQSLRRFELHTLEVLQTPSVGEVCEYPKVSSFLNSYLVLELVYVLASCSKKRETKGLPWWQYWLHQQKCRSKYSQCPAFDIKQSPAGRSPEGHQVQTRGYLSSNNAQSCFMLPLSVLDFSYALVWMYDCNIHS